MQFCLFLQSQITEEYLKTVLWCGEILEAGMTEAGKTSFLEKSAL